MRQFLPHLLSKIAPRVMTDEKKGSRQFAGAWVGKKQLFDFGHLRTFCNQKESSCLTKNHHRIAETLNMK
jgi:hypothetical protein